MRRHQALVFAALLGMAAGCLSAPTDPPRPCADFPPQSASPYVLPYAIGTSIRVIRTFTHYTPRNDGVGLYAIDFEMPIGTPVHAARGGTIVAVEKRYADGNNENLNENFVFVRHLDGTIGRYMHLTQNGAIVQVGEFVKQGQLLGFSGNSGQSTTPHLHFDVQSCGPNLPPHYNRLPCGHTLPVSFKNTDHHRCGLVPGRLYRAAYFVV